MLNITQLREIIFEYLCKFNIIKFQYIKRILSIIRNALDLLTEFRLHYYKNDVHDLIIILFINS